MSVNRFSYYMPTKIVYGVDALKSLKEYVSGQKTLLVTSKGHIQRGLLDKLGGLDIIAVVDTIRSHPEFKDLQSAYRTLLDIDFDIVVAIGGGSVIDGAKYFCVYADDEDETFVTRLVKEEVKKRYKTKPLVAIPTTAGTGSEITPWATIWDMEEKKKYSLYLPELFSKVALYDPTLTLSLPKEITIQTALDTLSHALESIWNKNANEITIDFAVKSAKLIIENLVPLTNDLKNLEYRDKIMKACMYAGLAFSNTQTALAHAMSYYITAYKGVPHGIACSFTLPMLIDNVIGKYDFVDKALMDIFGELSSNKLREFLRRLEVGCRFEDYGVSEEEVAARIDRQRGGNSLATLKGQSG